MRSLPQPARFAFTPAALKLAASHLSQPPVQRYIAEANREYRHWEKQKYVPAPQGLTAEEAWVLIKWSRNGKARSLPLLDQRGKPFSYWLPDSALALLHEVDRGGGSTLLLDKGAASSVDALREQVVISSLMEEAIATSQIEGAATTRKVAKEMLRANRKPRNRSERMIVNSYRTISLLHDRLDRRFSIELLNEIQESITRGTLDDPSAAGRFRRQGEDVSVVDLRDNEVVFTPPPAEQLPDRLERLIAFVNAPLEGEDFIHPLAKAAILHFWLAYEHPYVDGNGRTARALFYWYMLKEGYWLFEFLTVSRILLHAPMRYHRSFLYSETDDNDLTYSLVFQFQATRQALSQLRKYLEEKLQGQNRMTAVLRRYPGLNYRQRTLLEHALHKPNQIYTFQSHQNSHHITYVTARADVLSLLQQRLLQEVKAGKQRSFLAAENLATILGYGTRSDRKNRGKR